MSDEEKKFVHSLVNQLAMIDGYLKMITHMIDDSGKTVSHSDLQPLVEKASKKVQSATNLAVERRKILGGETL